MSVRAIFGPDINLPTIDEKFVYAVDGVAKLSGISIDGDTGILNHLLSSDGDGRCRWRLVEPGPPGSTPTLQEVCGEGNSTTTTMVLHGATGISTTLAGSSINIIDAQPSADESTATLSAARILFRIDSDTEGIHSLSLSSTQLVIDGNNGAATQYLGKSDGDNLLAWRNIADGPIGPQGPIGPAGPTGPEGPVANYSFIPSNFTPAQIVTVAGDSANNASNYWSFIDGILKFTRLAVVVPDPALSENKFNFSCFAGTVNLNNMVVGQINGLNFDYAITDFTTGLPYVGAVDIILAVYTPRKEDGSDMGFFYNSKLVFSAISPNQTYQLSEYTPAASQISTTYSPLDSVFFISIGSNSAESLVNWVFTLNSGTVFTTGPVGPTGATGAVGPEGAAGTVGIVPDDASKNFNNWVHIGPSNGSFNLPMAGSPYIGTTVTCYNFSSNFGVTLLVSGQIRDSIKFPASTDYLFLTIQKDCYATFICLTLAFDNRWVCIATNSSSTFT